MAISESGCDKFPGGRMNTFINQGPNKITSVMAGIKNF